MFVAIDEKVAWFCQIWGIYAIFVKKLADFLQLILCGVKGKHFFNIMCSMPKSNNLLHTCIVHINWKTTKPRGLRQVFLQYHVRHAQIKQSTVKSRAVDRSTIQFLNIFGVILTRWVSVVEFHDPTLCRGKVFGQESTVVKWNYRILSLHLVTVGQKVPILDFQSEFSMSKIIQIFLKKKIIEEYQFRRTFFVKSIVCWLQFLNHFITKMTPNFWRTVTWWRPKIW